jgi:L-lactate dehydrogenase complex protein LldF
MTRSQRLGLVTWAFLAKRPRLYQAIMRLAVTSLGAFGRRKGRFRRLPLAGGWTRHRDMPAPQGRTFQQLWAERAAGVGNDGAMR